MIVWRISNYATLDGEGGRLFPARWNSKGNPVVYAADHPAASLCEMLANTDAVSLPKLFQLLKIDAGDLTLAKAGRLPDDWIENPALTRNLGDKWLREGNSVLLRVPSAIVPESYNYLLNPMHPDMSKVRIDRTFNVPLDPRLK
jgi:RES domain-containing protein